MSMGEMRGLVARCLRLTGLLAGLVLILSSPLPLPYGAARDLGGTKVQVAMSHLLHIGRIDKLRLDSHLELFFFAGKSAPRMDSRRLSHPGLRTVLVLFTLETPQSWKTSRISLIARRKRRRSIAEVSNTSPPFPGALSN